MDVCLITGGARLSYRRAVARKFGQTQVVASQAKDLSPGGADTARYLADRAQDLADSRDRIDALMGANALDALLFANSGSAAIGARAGYPSITIPAGYQAGNRRPFNVTLLGRAWSEPTLVGYGYAFRAGDEAAPAAVG